MGSRRNYSFIMLSAWGTRRICDVTYADEGSEAAQFIRNLQLELISKRGTVDWYTSIYLSLQSGTMRKAYLHNAVAGVSRTARGPRLDDRIPDILVGNVRPDEQMTHMKQFI